MIGQETSTGWSYNGYDGLGSVRGIFDGTAAVVQSATYAPYGSLISRTGWSTSLGFTGEMQDVTGLVHLRARMYNPTTGTFLQRDPIMGVLGGASIYANSYLYANGNPINFIDPTGNVAEWVIGPSVVPALVPFIPGGPGVWIVVGIVVFVIIVAVALSKHCPPAEKVGERTRESEWIAEALKNYYESTKKEREKLPFIDPNTDPTRDRTQPRDDDEPEFIYREVEAKFWGSSNLAKAVSLRKPQDYFTGLSFWDKPVSMLGDTAGHLKYRISTLRANGFIVRNDAAVGAIHGVPGTSVEAIRDIVDHNEIERAFNKIGTTLHSDLAADHYSVYHPNPDVWLKWFRDDFTAARKNNGEIGSSMTYALYNLNEGLE